MVSGCKPEFGSLAPWVLESYFLRGVSNAGFWSASNEYYVLIARVSCWGRWFCKTSRLMMEHCVPFWLFLGERCPSEMMTWWCDDTSWCISNSCSKQFLLNMFYFAPFCYCVLFTVFSWSLSYSKPLNRFWSIEAGFLFYNWEPIVFLVGLWSSRSVFSLLTLLSSLISSMALSLGSKFWWTSFWLIWWGKMR